QAFRGLLDVSFPVKLEDGTTVPSVNTATTKTAPRVSLNQIGHVVKQLIHAFATADDDARIFSTKFNVNDGFWTMVLEEGKEWNFAFCMREMRGHYWWFQLCSRWDEWNPHHIFVQHQKRGKMWQHNTLSAQLDPCHTTNFLRQQKRSRSFKHYRQHPTTTTSVYVDDYIFLAIPTSQQQLQHVGQATLMGIHDVWPPTEVDDEDTVMHKKIKKGEGVWGLEKEILGLMFNGDAYWHTVKKGMHYSSSLQNGYGLLWKDNTKSRSRSFGLSFASSATVSSSFQLQKEFWRLLIKS
ncbi:hypothetical protein ACHAXS_000341, partial [Conticribra weissflogii]